MAGLTEKSRNQAMPLEILPLKSRDSCIPILAAYFVRVVALPVFAIVSDAVVPRAMTSSPD